MPVRSVTLKILGDDRDVKPKLDWVTARGDDIDKMHPTLKIGAEITDPKAKMAFLREEVAALTDRVHNFILDADDKAGKAKLLDMSVKLMKLDKTVSRPLISVRGMAESEADILRMSAQLDALGAKREAALVAQLPGWPRDQAGGGGGGFGGRGALGFLGGAAGANVSLFGGLKAISGLHLLADSLVEVAAVGVPAVTALVAFGAALTATAPDLQLMYQRELNMYTATDILGQKMPGLTGSLKDLSNTLKPGVFAVWGDALTVINSGTGEFSKLAQQAVNWVDTFAARIAVDLSHGGGAFDKFVQGGAHDLSLLGNLFGTIGNALVNMFKVAQTTHIAEDLIGVLTVVARLADLITKLPTPILATVVALHGVYLWGGLAASGLSKVAGVIGKLPGLGGIKVLSDIPGLLDRVAAKGLSAGSGLDFTVKGMRGVAQDAEGAAVKSGIFQTALAGLSEVPVWGWVAAGALALGGLVFWLSRSKDETQKWIDGINKGIAGSSNNNVFNVMAADVGQANAKIAESSKQVAAAVAPMNKVIVGSGEAMMGAASKMSPALDLAKAKEAAFAGETQAVIGQMNNFGKGVLWIMQTFHVGYPEALAIATEANVKLAAGITGNSKAAESARQQIVGLISGFAQLQTPAGQAGKDFEALAYASNDITKKISQLNSAWDSWIKSVTGDQTSFDTFAQGMDVLSSDSATYSYHLGKLTVKGSQTKAAIDDLTTSGLNLNQAFTQEVGNLGSLADALRTSNAPMSQQTASMKAGIAALIPYAAGSKEATSQLFALAQQANYTGDNSIKALSQWAGIKAPQALKIMKQQADAATTAASNLANTIQNLLNVQFEQDIIKSSGASQALQRYTQDLVNNKDRTAQGRSDRQNLINDLEKAGLNSRQASAYVDGLSSSLNRIPKQENPVVNMTGVGKFSITGGFSAGGVGSAGPNLGFPAPNQALLHPAAHGLLVSGGTPGVDSVHILAQEGEAVVPRHLVPAVAPFLSRHGVPGFEAGGYIGNVPGLGAFTTNMYLQFQNDMGSAMESGMKNAASTLASMFMSPGGGAGVTRWAGVILEALSLLHQSPALLGDVEHRMNQESGGNLTAVNNSDSNAAAGYPSTGLMQVIRGTYDAYAGPFINTGPFMNGVSINPLANVYAGLNYALHAYGSIAAAMLKSGGYANGGMITEPMFAMGASGRGLWLGERGPELVTPVSGAAAASGAAGGNIYIKVEAGDAIDPNAVAQAIHQKLRRYKTKKGNIKLGLD